MGPAAIDENALRADYCWENIDRVVDDTDTTDFKRLARWHQSLWRKKRGLPRGSQPYVPTASTVGRPIGSRIDLEIAKARGANLLTQAALMAATQRLANPEPYQTLHPDGLWADLLSSSALCFNLFGDIAGDADLAERCVRAWWPDAPNGTVRVRFDWSPRRRDATFLGTRSAFDVAFEITDLSGAVAVVGVTTKYHEHVHKGAAPKREQLDRYIEVTERSGAFIDGWRDAVVGKPLQQIWLDHLLCLSMLQHPSRQWTWGRFVLVYPKRNPSFTAAVGCYHLLLRDPSTFESRTIDELLDTTGALDSATVSAIRERYLW